VAGGEDPAALKQGNRRARSVNELCDLYLADAEAGRVLTRRKVPKKSSTLALDRGRVERHIKPLLGQLKVAAVTREDVDAFMHDIAAGKTAGSTKTDKKRGLARVRGGKTASSRAVGLLGAIFTYAIRHRMRTDNPAQGVIRFADGKRERRLSHDEYKSFGEALGLAGVRGVWIPAVAAARFLAITGWRSGEVLALRWNEIDLPRRTATLVDSKTGRSIRPLSHAACDVLRATPHLSALVFPATRGDGTMTGFRKLWNRIVALGPLAADVTPHVLRHSFTSLGADLGYTDSTIGAIVGHKGRTVTSRYVHTADAVLLAAADAIADKTAELMAGAPNLLELRRDWG
jgi:integrase